MTFSMTLKDVPFSKAFYTKLVFLILYTMQDLIVIYHLVIFILCIVVVGS